jgi:hypothetical protein
MVILTLKVRIKKQENNQNQNKTFQGKKFASSRQKTIKAGKMKIKIRTLIDKKKLKLFSHIAHGL